MDQYEYIRIARRVYKHSIKRIARDTGHSRNTVRKILYGGEIPGYGKRTKQPYPVLGPFCRIIDGWLESDKSKPIKQRHTARRIYTRLKEEHNFSGGESTVRYYVRHAKLRLGLNKTAVFIPGDPEIGREAEVDWGIAEVEIDGRLEQVHFFSMRSKFSGKHFVRCYRSERQQLFFDAHIHAFSFFGGIFPVLIYDNLTTAVKKVFQGRKRELTESYRKFKSYYTFEARFCNPGQGHEKGGVEGQVGYVRRNYFVPVPQISNLETFNEWLLTRCVSYGDHRVSGREQTVQEYFDVEREHLLPLPEQPFSNVETIRSRVDKYATVIVDKNRYSVPSRYGHHWVTVLVGANEVTIYYDQHEVARHIRQYGSNNWQLDADHYLELLKQRPQAFDTSRPIRESRKSWPPCLERLLQACCRKQGSSKGIKDFITVLELYRDHPSGDIEAAVELSLESGVCHSEGIKYLLGNTLESSPPRIVVPNWPSLPQPNLDEYGVLGGVQ